MAFYETFHFVHFNYIDWLELVKKKKQILHRFDLLCFTFVHISLKCDLFSLIGSKNTFSHCFISTCFVLQKLALPTFILQFILRTLIRITIKIDMAHTRKIKSTHCLSKQTNQKKEVKNIEQTHIFLFSCSYSIGM